MLHSTALLGGRNPGSYQFGPFASAVALIAIIGPISNLSGLSLIHDFAPCVKGEYTERLCSRLPDLKTNREEDIIRTNPGFLYLQA